MKLASAVFLLGALGSASAFAPVTSTRAFVVAKEGKVARFLSQENVPFFADSDQQAEEMSLEEEVDALVKEEVAKKKKVSNLRNANGVDYAPWMNISEEDEEKIRQVMQERAEARRKRQLQEKSVSGNLYYDSQAQELSGTGLTCKVIDGDVELEWATKAETNTKGFIVRRRPAKTEEFAVIASYENFGPLASQGPDGGVYRYLDDGVSPGGYVYRISECDKDGNESDLCQNLVDVQTADEQRAAVLAAVGIAVVGIAAVVAGIVLDPLDGY